VPTSTDPIAKAAVGSAVAEGGVATAPPSDVRGSVTRRMAGGMAAMAVLSTVANILNYASSLVFSRVLEPIGFGELTSLLALSIVLAVPLGAAQTVVAERITRARLAGEEDRVRYLIRYALGHVTVLSLIVGVIYVACIPLVVQVLDVREPGPAIALAPLVVLTFLNVVSQGVLQGMERFTAFGVLLFGMAISRLAFGVPWAYAGGGAGGAIAGQALGILVVNIALAWRYRDWLIGRGSGAASRGARRKLDLAGISASGAFVGFALLSNLDLVLARVYLDNHDAGVYAALATVAKVMIFLPSAVAVLMVPSAARAHAETGSGGRVLRLCAVLVAGAAVVCAIPALVAPDLVLKVMFGGGYEAAVDGVLPAVLAGAGLAMLNIVCVYSVTIRDRRWMFLLVGGVGLQIVALGLFHSSPEEIAWVQATVALVVLLVNEALFHSVRPRRRTA
jgi:O-antigen/teichoic acid export membrane protein